MLTELEKRLQAYRARLLKAGKLLEARAVARCIALVKKDGTNHGSKNISH